MHENYPPEEENNDEEAWPVEVDISDPNTVNEILFEIAALPTTFRGYDSNKNF